MATIEPMKPDVWAMLEKQAEVIAASRLAPASLQNRPEAILTIALKGHELGIPPMMALSHIHVVQGRPTLSAELMRALVLNAGHRIWPAKDNNNTKSTWYGQRWNEHTQQYDETIESTFTMEDAKRAGLVGKDNWKKYPGMMLDARATAILCRQVFPDVMMGAGYTPDEIDPDVDLDMIDLREEPNYSDIPDLGARRSPDSAAEAGGTQGTTEASPPQEEPVSPPSVAPITNAQKQKLAILMKDLGIRTEGNDVLYRAGMMAAYGVDSTKDLTRGQANLLIEMLEKGTSSRTPEEVANAFLWKGSAWLAEQEAKEQEDEPETE